LSHHNPNPYQTPPANGVVAQAAPVARTLNPNPGVKTWQMVYLIAMLFLYLAVAVGGLLLALFRAEIAATDPESREWELAMMGTIYGVMGALFFAVFSVGLFWRRGMGGWIYNIVLISFGLMSCCTLPVAIPLLIFWIKHKDDIVLG
jgi:hypothetical protein